MIGTSLPALTALARAGAVGRGWDLFVAAGYHLRGDDPATLAVKGRLLKGRARIAPEAQRAPLLAEAAAAYTTAHSLAPAPYLIINAASLSLLAGDRSRAQVLARQVLALLDAPDPPADTPYFLEATRAEALLLLEDHIGAQAALDRAIVHDPDGWADRATTVVQLREIAGAQGGDTRWIEGYAPPASLHFAGHMGFAAGGASEKALVSQLEQFLESNRIGFAWGALAAGSDIIVAERLIAHGVDLNLVLPCPVPTFENQSVAPAGSSWVTRFHALLDQACTIRIAADAAGAAHDPMATLHAGELAIGAALNHATNLGSKAFQLVVLDAAGGGANTARQAALWRKDLGVQQCLTLARDSAVESAFPPEAPDPARRLALHLAVEIDGLSALEAAQANQIAALCQPVSAVLQTLPSECVCASAGRWDAVIEDLPLGMAIISRLLALGYPAIGAHLAIGTVLHDGASGKLVPFGPPRLVADHLLQMSPPGVALASDALAVTLKARNLTELRAELYHPGEDPAAGAVHSLTPAPTELI